MVLDNLKYHTKITNGEYAGKYAVIMPPIFVGTLGGGIPEGDMSKILEEMNVIQEHGEDVILINQGQEPFVENLKTYLKVHTPRNDFKFAKVELPLPADEGHEAFRNRKTPDDNPYPESDWRHNEWQFGWDCEEQSSDDLFDWDTGTFRADPPEKE